MLHQNVPECIDLYIKRSLLKCITCVNQYFLLPTYVILNKREIILIILVFENLYRPIRYKSILLFFNIIHVNDYTLVQIS